MEINQEKFVIDNPDGSVSLDPYAGMSREELKTNCGHLCCALDSWQHIAMTLYESGKERLSVDQTAKVTKLIEAYRD